MSHTNTQENGVDTGKNLNIDYYITRKGASVLRALNHTLRQQIIQAINENDKITVTELYIKLRLEQSVASQHLAILRQAGIVNTKREGKFIYYSVNVPKIEAIQNFTRELLA